MTQKDRDCDPSNDRTCVVPKLSGRAERIIYLRNDLIVMSPLIGIERVLAIHEGFDGIDYTLLKEAAICIRNLDEAKKERERKKFLNR